MKRIVTADNVTGHVVSQWTGDDSQTLQPVTGRTHREVADNATDYSGQRWTGSAFEPIPAAVPRVLSRIDFARLFTQAEDIAIDGSADVAVRFLQRRMQMAQTVSLDHLDVQGGLSLLVAKGLLTEARKTRILAGLPPS